LKKNVNIKILPSLNNVCATAVDIFLDLLDNDSKNSFIVPGGTTPVPFYKHLARRIQNWEGVTLCLSDERLVNENSIYSNYRMIKEKLNQSKTNVKKLNLISFFNDYSKNNLEYKIASLNQMIYPIMPFKAAFLGIGRDGHTASLFPEVDYDDKQDPLTIIKRIEEPFNRISISLRVLAQIPFLIFMVAGKDKKEVLNQIVNKTNNSDSIIVNKLISRCKGKVLIICDQDAASCL